jgi:hypothetical protein
MYQIVGEQSGKCLNIPLSSTSDGALLEILTCTGGANQLFRPATAPGGYTFTNVNSGKCLDAVNTTKGTRLAQSTCNGSLTQVFLPLSVIRSGYYTMNNAASTYCIDVESGITYENTVVHQWSCTGATNQSWQFGLIAGPCTPEGDATFCTRLGANCGQMKGSDNCGTIRAVRNCGPCPSIVQACGVTTPNVCGVIGKTNLAQGGTATASVAGAAGNAFDGDAMTKYYIVGTSTPWIAYQFAGAATKVVTSYSVTSGNDWTDRDPAAWQLQGSNDGMNWTTLDTQIGQYFGNRFQTNYFTFTNATAYSNYRLNVTANDGSPDFQLAEIQLFP